MRKKCTNKCISSAVIAIFFISQTLLFCPPKGYAQTPLNLPAPGTMIGLSPAYTPAIVAGITIYPDDPLQFDFIIDVGDDHLEGEALRRESQKLISYFMATLTVPEDEMWVNLSPYEKERIIADGLGNTLMGRDMLAQDYILKQLTASMMYPEDKLGNEFWQRVYKKAQDKFGTTEIPTDTFNKIWIIPEEAVIYANGTNIFIADSRLKVMLEEDYLALEHHDKGIDAYSGNQDMTQEAKAIIKEVLLPEIEREVNEGKNFAPLRQIYHSMILATWYKNNLKESLLGKVYVNQNKVEGVDVEDKDVKNKIYNQYVEAFKKGVYNYIREDYDEATKKIIPRKYFSGGEDFARLSDEAMSLRGSISRTDWLQERGDSPKVRVRTRARLNQVSSPIEGIKVFISPEELRDYEAELEKEAHLFIERNGMGTLQQVKAKLIRRIAKVMVRNRRDIDEGRQLLREKLEEELKWSTEDTMDNILYDHPDWVQMVQARRRTSNVLPSSKEAFVDTALDWITERFGNLATRSQVKLSFDISLPGHNAAALGTVVYRFKMGIAYLQLYHELLHLTAGGFDMQWLDEATTEKLTKDLFEELGEEQVGEKPIYYFMGAQESLESIANVIGWQPILLSYLTGDESYFVEALGSNGAQAYQLIESISSFRGLESALLEGILTNLDSEEQLNGLGQYLAEQSAFLERDEIDWREFRERVNSRLDEMKANKEAKAIERYALSETVYSGLEELSKSDANPTVKKIAAEMLVKSDIARASSSPLSPDYGGIDFNAGNLNLKEQGQAIDINFGNFPNIQANTVNGVTPIIINITPIVNFPLLLGFNDTEQNEPVTLSRQ